MQFLSVAARELRVAARKRSSFRLRLLTSTIALFTSGFSLWFVTLFGSRPLSGEQLFFVLSCVTFGCACIVGPALTADCVNEDRNNGTLGLLFLTNLHALSVSLGKLVGHGLLALYSIVSIVPVMALPVCLGGTDAESLAKTALVLFLTLILSLVIGMFASTVCRKPWLAAAVSLFILAVLVMGIPLAAFVLRVNQQTRWSAGLEVLSPSYALSMARPNAGLLSSNHLWVALSLQLLLALSFFGFVTFLLPRIWKEEEAGPKARYLASVWRRWQYGPEQARRGVRRRLLQINPILWLSVRERFGAVGHALVFLLLACAISWVGQHIRLGPPDPFLNALAAWIAGIPLLYLAFCFRLASVASGRFALDRKTGALELILSTPLKTREIIRGHWLGLLRRFWGAALLLLALHAFILNYIMESIRLELPQFGLREVLVRPFIHIFQANTIPNEVAPFYIGCLAVLAAAFLIMILWAALGWLGIALSLKLRRELLAPWVSLFLLAVPPLPVFVSLLPVSAGKQLFASNLFLGMLFVGATGFFLVLGNALIWLVIARRWTYRKLRAMTSSSPSVEDPGKGFDFEGGDSVCETGGALGTIRFKEHFERTQGVQRRSTVAPHACTLSLVGGRGWSNIREDWRTKWARQGNGQEICPTLK